MSLTSFETVLLDCIVTAVITMCIKKKKLSKTGEFLCSHFNSEDERKLHFLAYYALFYQVKCKKRFVQCMEKMLWLIEHFRSGLQFHAGDSSLDETFHGQDLPQSSRRVEVDSDQMEILRTINVIPHER